MKSKVTNKTVNNHKKNKTKTTQNSKNMLIKKIKKIIKLILILLLIIAIAIFIFISGIFNITEINITGNERIQQDKILQLSGIKLNDNIFLLSKNKIVRTLKEEPYIENVKVVKKLPDKIQIIVEERERAFMLKNKEGYSYIDNQGYILENTNEKIDKPIIYGYKTESDKIVPGNRLNEEDLESLGIILNIIKNTQKVDIYNKITYIQIENKEFILYLQEEKKLIYLGDGSSLANRMLYAKDMIDREKGKEGKIFVDGNFSNGFKPRFREEANTLQN